MRKLLFFFRSNYFLLPVDEMINKLFNIQLGKVKKIMLTEALTLANNGVVSKK